MELATEINSYKDSFMKTKQLLQLTLLSSLLVLISTSLSYAQPPQIIDVVKGYEPIPLALVPFETSRGAEQYAQQLQEVLQFDLDFTNFFYLIPSKGLIDEVDRQDKAKKKVDYAAWREIGADAVVKGEINVTRSGQIEVEFQIYYAKRRDAGCEKEISSFSSATPPQSWAITSRTRLFFT